MNKQGDSNPRFLGSDHVDQSFVQTSFLKSPEKCCLLKSLERTCFPFSYLDLAKENVTPSFKNLPGYSVKRYIKDLKSSSTETNGTQIFLHLTQIITQENQFTKKPLLDLQMHPESQLHSNKYIHFSGQNEAVIHWVTRELLVTMKSFMLLLYSFVSFSK